MCHFQSWNTTEQPWAIKMRKLVPNITQKSKKYNTKRQDNIKKTNLYAHMHIYWVSLCEVWTTGTYPLFWIEQHLSYLWGGNGDELTSKEDRGHDFLSYYVFSWLHGNKKNNMISHSWKYLNKCQISSNRADRLTERESKQPQSDPTEHENSRTVSFHLFLGSSWSH